jgi:hypothetical protein
VASTKTHHRLEKFPQPGHDFAESLGDRTLEFIKAKACLSQRDASA